MLPHLAPLCSHSTHSRQTMFHTRVDPAVSSETELRRCGREGRYSLGRHSCRRETHDDGRVFFRSTGGAIPAIFDVARATDGDGRSGRPPEGPDAGSRLSPRVCRHSTNLGHSQGDATCQYAWNVSRLPLGRSSIRWLGHRNCAVGAHDCPLSLISLGQRTVNAVKRKINGLGREG